MPGLCLHRTVIIFVHFSMVFDKQEVVSHTMRGIKAKKQSTSPRCSK